MAKPLKIALWIVGGLLLLVAGTLAALPFFFDPNDYRDDVARAVQKATGRELTIHGDVSLRVFPWLAIRVGETTLSNAPGFGDAPMLEFRSLEAGVKLLPLLLRREVEIGTVRAEGLTARLATKGEGQTNWADLVKEEAGETTQEPTGRDGFQFSSFRIGGLDVEDASFIYTDHATDQQYRAEQVQLQTGAVQPGEPVKLVFASLLTATEPDVTADLRLQGTLVPEMEQKRYELRDLDLQVAARGAPVPAGAQTLQLRAPAVQYGQAEGTLAIPELSLTVAGVTAQASAAASGMGSEQTSFNGRFTAENIDVRRLAKDLGINLPATADETVLQKASMRATFEGSTKAARVTELAAKLDDTTVSGTAAITSFEKQAIEFVLKVDKLDADRYLPPEEAGAAAKKSKEPAGDINAIEMPVQMLDKFNLNGTASIGTLKVKNLRMSEVVLKVAATKGAPKTIGLTANAYGGKIQHSMRITPGAKPSYNVDAKVSSIKAGPVQQDFLGKAFLLGTGDVTMSLTSTGAKVGDIRRDLDGSLSFRFLDGAVKGFNLAQAIRKSRALLRREAYAEPEEPPATDFAELAASAQITNGTLRTDTLAAKSPLFRLTGAGTIDLAAEQINLLAQPTIVQTLQGQGGAGLEELRGVTIPIRISGSLFDPKVRFDWDAIVKDKAKARLQEEKQEAREKIERKLEDKVQKGLKDFLRPRRDAPASPPAESPSPSEQPQSPPSSEGAPSGS